jgi:four helix bundle protein
MLNPFGSSLLGFRMKQPGIRRAPSKRMAGATRHEELIAWQLADQIRICVLDLTKGDGFAKDLKLRSQTEDAANSVCRNIAEGFSCKHVEFARFLKISRRSLNELRDAFRAAQLKQHVTASDYAPIETLSRRLYRAFSRLIEYLETTPDPPRTNPTNRTNRTSRNCTNRTNRTSRTNCTNRTNRTND